MHHHEWTDGVPGADVGWSSRSEITYDEMVVSFKHSMHPERDVNNEDVHQSQQRKQFPRELEKKLSKEQKTLSLLSQG